MKSIIYNNPVISSVLIYISFGGIILMISSMSISNSVIRMSLSCISGIFVGALIKKIINNGINMNKQ